LSFKVVIPARYASSRLPGKALLDLGGKPMFMRVAEQAAASGAEEVLLATDHPDILNAALAEGLRAILTDKGHASGTERLAEVAAKEAWPPDTLVVNVQGDEPLIPPALIREAAETLADSGADIATFAHLIADAEEFFNPNVVKVVLNRMGDALFFSRAPIPYARDAFSRGRAALPQGLPAYRHVGLYAYRAAFLRDFSRIEASSLEGFESLEQLRALWHGYRIRVALTSEPLPPGVDTPEDAERMRALFAARGGH
jgi:3-deoxy-manno-octulosonate cytidylyltransferase (CMP-KDO synthetase)